MLVQCYSLSIIGIIMNPRHPSILVLDAKTHHHMAVRN